MRVLRGLAGSWMSALRRESQVSAMGCVVFSKVLCEFASSVTYLTDAPSWHVENKCDFARESQRRIIQLSYLASSLPPELITKAAAVSDDVIKSWHYSRRGVTLRRVPLLSSIRILNWGRLFSSWTNKYPLDILYFSINHVKYHFLGNKLGLLCRSTLYTQL